MDLKENFIENISAAALQRFSAALRSRCECCDQGGQALSIYEIEPLPEEPSPDHALFLCDSCIKQIKNPKNEST